VKISIRYSVLWSILVFLRHPGEHFRELLVDVITMVVYTPSTVTSTYMLMLLCESLAKSSPKFRKTFLSHVMAFTAIFGNVKPEESILITNVRF
jgi:hypothetical protein